MASAMKQYSSLIVAARRANRKKLDIGDQAYVYFEWHHIWPKCFGRDDRKQNLVLLTFAEHVEAHVLLAKLYPRHYGLQQTANWMLTDKKGEPASVEVAIDARALAASATGDRNHQLALEGRHPTQISAASKTNYFQSEASAKFSSDRMTKLALENKHPAQLAAAAGTLFSQSAEGRAAAREQWAEDKHPSKSAKNKARLAEQVQCPECRKWGGLAGMQRHHFDNCLQHPNNLGLTRKQIRDRRAATNVHS